MSSVALLMVGWCVVSATGAFPESFFPSPTRVYAATLRMFGFQGFLTDVLASAARIGVAFLVCAILGVPLGLLMSSFKSVEALVEPLVDFLRYVPVPALLPIFVLWSGIGEAP